MIVTLAFNELTKNFNYINKFPTCQSATCASASHCVKSVRIRSYSGPHFDWIRRDTEYLSVFSQNAGKCGKNADQNNSEYRLFLRRVNVSCTINLGPVFTEWDLDLHCWTNTFEFESTLYVIYLNIFMKSRIDLIVCSFIFLDYFIYLLFGCPKANFGPLLCGQTH